MNNCSCIYVEDIDPAEFHNSRVVTARKAHKCGECGKEILPGSKYEYNVGTWEGNFNTHKTCSICLELRNEFFCDGWYYGQIHEYLWNHIQEVDGEISQDCLLALSLGARAIVVNMIDRVWGGHDNPT